MDLRKREAGSKFADVLVDSICYNFRKRFEKRMRKPLTDREDTWSTSLIRNRNKLRSVLVKPVRQAVRSSAWQHWITAKRDRLTQLMNPYHRWYRKEYRILEKVNGMRFEQEAFYACGSAWAYVVSKQRLKLEQKRLPGRLTLRVRRGQWAGCLARGKAEFLRLMAGPVEECGSWDFVILGAARKLNLRMDSATEWEARIVESARRWWRISP
jgi:hypothetical protein